ncbi:hypothetical protein JMF97_25770 [Micromonospora fiedleri]|uniref:DUF3558 domain-containing protein n=1 Tax=Micromonospora fiedleri TaxID=1157498 RepID=A0ABS1UT99_9ACTN|nr:hypothetical protein [Micromonospora fiedleri]MBL6279568.1 hypothetical protein [Micromonospora fiedleri]
MRRLILPVLLATALALTGCGDSEPAAPGTGSDAGSDADLDLPVDGADAVRPACPFTAEQVTGIVGQQLDDKGNCSFGDGIALLTVTTASRVAGEMTYDYQRQQADQTYQSVTDLGVGDKGYLAVKDIEAEAVVINGAGSFTVTLSSFPRLGAQPDGYAQAMRKLADALPS